MPACSLQHNPIASPDKDGFWFCSAVALVCLTNLFALGIEVDNRTLSCNISWAWHAMKDDLGAVLVERFSSGDPEL